jgi:hypothetical protein
MNRISRVIKLGIGVALAVALVSWAAPQPGATEITVYKSPTCGCCGKWAEHMKQAGFNVTTVEANDVSKIKTERGVPAELSSCHTAVVGGYLVEGHVPASDVQRLLAERPKVKGLAVPSMPPGSPGMDGPRRIPYNTLTFDDRGQTTVYERH